MDTLCVCFCMEQKTSKTEEVKSEILITLLSLKIYATHGLLLAQSLEHTIFKTKVYYNTNPTWGYTTWLGVLVLIGIRSQLISDISILISVSIVYLWLLQKLCDVPDYCFKNVCGTENYFILITQIQLQLYIYITYQQILEGMICVNYFMCI